MAKQVLKNARIFAGGYDLSGDSNQVALKYSAEILDSTVFNAASKGRTPGLLDTGIEASGFWDDATAVADTYAGAKLAVVDTPITAIPSAAAQGDLAYFFKSLLGEYSPGAAVGELLKFSLTAQGTDSLLRGNILEYAIKTATAAGAAQQLGAVLATQKLYAVMHVLEVSGTNPTLDMLIQSDSAQAFSSPETKITFARATEIGAQYAVPVDGAILDEWWRCSWTIGGTDNPSFTVAVAMAIM